MFTELMVGTFLFFTSIAGVGVVLFMTKMGARATYRYLPVTRKIKINARIVDRSIRW